ncbi:HAD-IIB family hydrolase [Xylocopilactobacillus apis]|uniref:Haloacid dehalogenase n=1 Tax=Xylocopilactobacillus apis TaxID=2932183 RepID=A0AAU9CZI8_9LACO|nr:HAD-IIB family hydrolase [Xylocopilactobacillus apis]BDR55661.1 haloacid dehalogenase [Xylocopilactobacillus apis]
MIKKIFLDLDETLLNSKGELPLTKIKTINKCSVPITLVSARSPKEMEKIIDILNLNGPQIAFNGGLIFERKNSINHILFKQEISKKSVLLITNFILNNFPDISLNYYDDNKCYTFNQKRKVQISQPITSIKPRIIKHFEINQKNIYKIILKSSNSHLLWRLYRKLAYLCLFDVSIKQSGKMDLEITPSNARKDHAFKFAAKGLEKSEIAACVNSYKNLPMLKYVGLPIVMNDADSKIKSVAKYITKSNDENRVAYGIKHFIEETR